MLKTLKLHNFKTFLNAEFSFKRRHLVLGKNNSGKTNLASAIQFLAATRHIELGHAANSIFGGLGELCNWHLKSNQVELSCTCDLEFESESCQFTYDLVVTRDLPRRFSRGGEPEMRVVRERLAVSAPGVAEISILDSNGHEVRVLDEEQAFRPQGQFIHKTIAPVPQNATMLSKLYESDTNRRAILFRNYLGSLRYFAFHPEAIRRTQNDSEPGRFPLAANGSGLASAVFQMKNADESRYRRLVKHVQTIEPALEAINFFTAPDLPPLPFLSLAGQTNCSWTGLSDGTLRVLALAYIIEFSGYFGTSDWPNQFFAVVEEPENGIYPGQLRRIFDLFNEWAPAAQFIFTSHSRDFIDMFDNQRDAVTILRKGSDRTESFTPPKARPPDNGDIFTLSQEYSSELLG